ncbi:hypothetical protein AB8Q19_02205 [Candidatus Profftella armatura]
MLLNNTQVLILEGDKNILEKLLTFKKPNIKNIKKYQKKYLMIITMI